MEQRNLPSDIRSLLTPPAFPESEDRTRIAQALHFVILGVSATLVLVFIPIVFLAERKFAAGFLLLLTLLANVLIVRVMRRGRVQLASIVYLSVCWLIVAVFVYLSAGTLTVSASLFIAIIVMSALFLGSKASFVTAAVTLVYMFGLEVTRILGFAIPQYFPFPGISGWIVLVYSVILALIPVISINHSLRKALRDAREHLTLREQAEHSLRESEQRFRSIFELTQAAIVISNTDGKIVSLNPSALAQMGRTSREEVIGRDPVELGLFGDAAMQRDLTDLLVAQGGVLLEREIALFRSDGSTQTALFSATTIELSGVPHVLIIALDITDRKRADESLARERKLMRAVIDHLPDNVYVKDREGRFILNNRESLRILGATRQEDVLGKSDFDFLSEALAERWTSEHQSIMDAGEPILNVEVFQPWQAEHRRWIVESMIPLRDDQGEVIALVGINRDITDRKRAEITLKQEKELSESIINTLPGIFFFYDITDDLNGRLVRWNQNFERLTQYTVTVFQKMKILDWFSLEEQPRIAEAVRETLSRRIVKIEANVLDVSGKPVPYLYNLSSMTMGDRRYLIGTGMDISQRKLAEDGLHRSEALLRALLDATTDVAFLMSADGTFLTANKTLAQSMNLTVEAMVGRPALQLLPPDIEAYRRQYFDQAAQTRKPVRWEDESGNGWWDNSIYPVLSVTGEVEAFAVYSRDTTESKHLAAELLRYTAQLEQMVEERTGQLRRAKEQIELILNNTSDALALSQPNGDIQTLNPAFIAMFDEQTASSIEHILWAIPNGDQIAAVSNALLNVIYDSETKRVEAQIVAKDGKDKDIDLALIPVYAGDGDLRPGILVSARDITHLKEIERFKARFVADAVHDLATPISGLGTRLYMLRRAPERLEEHIRALENQVEHLRNLLADLRTLSQLDHGNVSLSLEICNLNALVQRVFDTYEPVALLRQQSFRLIADPTLPRLSLDSRQIERVLVNLVSNAIHYTPDEREITIRTSLDDDAVIVSVADQGIGISAEDLPHIFDRFYRTTQARQTESEGTGLGLAIVKEIVELHGGSITVTSEPERGSTFVVRLPIRR